MRMLSAKDVKEPLEIVLKGRPWGFTLGEVESGIAVRQVGRTGTAMSDAQDRITPSPRGLYLKIQQVVIDRNNTCGPVNSW